MNIFNALIDEENENENEFSYDEDYYDEDYYDEDTSKNFTLKEVDTLYMYFVNEGLSNEPQFSSHQQNWRIEKHHLNSALIRNDGDINASGKEIDEMIKNDSFEIRTFYGKLKYKDYTHHYTHSIYKKPYLSGQEWQIKPEIGIYLVYNNDEVYQISGISLVYGGNVVLDRVITKQYNVKSLNFSHTDVKYGKYKKINEDELQDHLNKDYKHNIIEKFEKIYDIRNQWLAEKKDKIIWYEDIIDTIEKYHKNNCTVESKLILVGKFNLPIDIISKIIGYGIESKCFHNHSINSAKKEIKDLIQIIDDDYAPYKNALWKKEVSYHVLQGNYEKWLQSFF
jgi:hypothetical protein